MRKKYQLKEKLWLYPGKAGWYFITIPSDVAKEIDFFYSHKKRGWGSLPVKVQIKQTTWTTSIFPDKKTDTYLLPIKSQVRKEEHLNEEREVEFLLEVIG